MPISLPNLARRSEILLVGFIIKKSAADWLKSGRKLGFLVLAASCQMSSPQVLDIVAIAEHMFTSPSLEGIDISLKCVAAHDDENLKLYLIEKRNKNQESVLHKATQKKSLECVRLLIDMGK